MRSQLQKSHFFLPLHTNNQSTKACWDSLLHSDSPSSYCSTLAVLTCITKFCTRASVRIKSPRCHWAWACNLKLITSFFCCCSCSWTADAIEEPSASRVPCGPWQRQRDGPAGGTVGLSTPLCTTHSFRVRTSEANEHFFLCCAVTHLL